MENKNRFCGFTALKRSTHWILPVFLVAGAMSAPAAAAENDQLINELRRQLAERDAEIAALKQRLARTGEQTRLARSAAAPSALRDSRPAEGDDESSRALESALVKQGGGVLRAGTVELEPEIFYLYSEPTGTRRRDNLGLALNARFGLPASWQADVRVPYVVRDHWSGVGTSSGVGDVRLGLTRELLPGTEQTPSLLAFGQWRTATGDINRNPPTGFGQQAVQVGLSTVKRQDPIVLFGSLFYTANIGSAHLRNGTGFRAGNLFGGRLAGYLAATPDTTLYSGLAFNSNMADRLNGNRIDDSSRLSGVLELGTTTVIGRDRFLNISGGIGVTPAAPKFSLTVSLPVRF
jgi:hypothetical protein